MTESSNVRTLRPLPTPAGEPCSLCNSRTDVVLCSFAFERIHRRVPLCREHRQPLIEIDHFTRPATAEREDLPPAWAAAASRMSRRTSRKGRTPRPTERSVLLLPVR
jgi:hypothetical protein